MRSLIVRKPEWTPASAERLPCQILWLFHACVKTVQYGELVNQRWLSKHKIFTDSFSCFIFCYCPVSIIPTSFHRMWSLPIYLQFFKDIVHKRFKSSENIIFIHNVFAWLWWSDSKEWNYFWRQSWCFMDCRSSESFPTCFWYNVDNS